MLFSEILKKIYFVLRLIYSVLRLLNADFFQPQDQLEAVEDFGLVGSGACIHLEEPGGGLEVRKPQGVIFIRFLIFCFFLYQYV